MLGERERAAAIKSRPTWAMNTTAGSAARAGAVAAAHTPKSKSAAERVPAARHTALRHHGRLPVNAVATVVMRGLPLGHP